ncbi:hypothetical protein Ade02nite_72450 [Paractinoplanes deccanensis]|uniref:WXG100 family type VII secretion target n=1 Tax=Paractinoplanes deccanensis TaxID=113561 RepID=A0ABQ3YF46_9ACTN|nr:hypothetical protein [Actinoplanes deccanensis]GID78604.1 hypothetical protein Ade02nite_72450 [Actinoplanes deccanensis]
MSASSTEADLLDKITSTLERIEAKTAELQGSINDKLGWLPGFVRDKVVAGWNRFCDYLGRVWTNLNEILSHMGSPSALGDTADAWSDLVGGPVSAQVQTAEAGLLGADDKWDGAAADAYRQTLPLQKAALDKVKSTLTDGISTALSTVATGIIAFWAGLVVALVALATGIVGALASSATILGVPAAPVIAAGAALTASAALIAGAETLKAVCASANSLLRQKLADNSAFHEGHWPPAAKA